MQRCYRMLPAFVFSIILGVYLLSPLKAASPTLNEDGVPAAVQERLAALGQNPIKAMNPQDKEISLFYAGSALWQGMNVACGDGNYMYGYPFLGLQIIDVSNPFSPEVIAEYHHPAAAEDMVIDGNYLYVAAGYEGGLLIFDVSDPHEPILTGSLMTVDNMPLEPYGIEIIGATAYLSCGLKFVIADISDPSSPQVLHVVDPVGVAYDAIIMDSYAYIASEVFVELWDISGDPAPIYVGGQKCGNDAFSIAASGEILYVANRGEGLYVLNTALYGWPTPVGQWVDSTSNYPEVEAAGTYAYLRSHDTIKIIDVQAPTAPVLAADWPTGGNTYSMYLSGNEAYLADWHEGIARYDISSPTAPALDAQFVSPGTGFDLAVSGNFGYEANGYKGLQVLDLSVPESPVAVASYDTPGRAWAVGKAGNAVYISDETAVVTVLDVSDPHSPAYVETINTTNLMRDIVVVGEYAYMVGVDSLLVLDISDALSPVRAASVYVSGSANYMAIQGNYAYISVHSVGLQVVDISNPVSPSLIATCPIGYSCFGVGLVGNYVYLSHGYRGNLTIIDISDPANPTVAVELPELIGWNAWVHNMQVVGDYLYMASYTAGLEVYNISDPLSPYLAGGYNTLPLWAWDVDVAGDIIYVICDNGFIVLSQADCNGPDGAGGFNIADAVYLIHYIFTGGPAPDPLRTGDVDCDGAVNLGDAVYLIDFIFRDGQPPCGGCY